MSKYTAYEKKQRIDLIADRVAALKAFDISALERQLKNLTGLKREIVLDDSEEEDSEEIIMSDSEEEDSEGYES